MLLTKPYPPHHDWVVNKTLLKLFCLVFFVTMMREVANTLVDRDPGTENVPLIKRLDTLSRDGIPYKVS